MNSYESESSYNFTKNLNINDLYFKILLKLSCISSSSKIYEESYGKPKRDCIFSSENKLIYWIDWDFGSLLVNELAILSRTHNLNPKNSSFWTLINAFYQSKYDEDYEFMKEVTLDSLDFDGICKAITYDNIIIINNYSFIPSDADEATGHYGECVCWRKWKVYQHGKFIRTIHTDSYSLAKDIYFLLNNNYTTDDDYGVFAKKLEFYSRSIFDH